MIRSQKANQDKHLIAVTMRSISRDADDERRIVDLSLMEPIGHFYDVSPSGEIVWVRYDKGKSELWLSDFPN